ncbi:GT4 family glycosyltransferase PelF [Rhodovibrio sodomensis]|uniref:GT4 family glycosyltransferase PelF n=1 Tax=Rhodovibrio sodomensis TaxID=1088 RepID=UPI0019044917
MTTRHDRSSPDGPAVDVCLVLEGTYPYVTGGVSAWVHEIIQGQSHLSFALVCLHAGNMELVDRYQLPDNVVGRRNVHIQRLPDGPKHLRAAERICREVEAPLRRITIGPAGLEAFREILASFRTAPKRPGRHALLNSNSAWNLVVRMYEANHDELSYIDYFWSWRTLVGGLYAGLLADLPHAGVYHAVSTGYAGLIAARGSLETGRPALLSEHGLYTNERRVELAMANWLHDTVPPSLNLGQRPMDLRDLWINTFASYARACYEASARIVTLHDINRKLQIADGAPSDRVTIVPNGIDTAAYGALRSVEAPVSRRVALIGRVVPIKDVASFIQACSLMADILPDVTFEVLGPTDEEPEYYDRCLQLVRHFGLTRRFRFRGKVDVKAEIGDVDVMVLSSISESQPLTILEAGAAGIPTVATDVGGCREMLEGLPYENPRLGPSGTVVPVASPQDLAAAVIRLYQDADWYARCARTARQRTRTYYDKANMHAAYRDIYAEAISAETGPGLDRQPALES